MKRHLLLESLSARWCPSVSHAHDEPTPPVDIEPSPVVVVPEPTPEPVTEPTLETPPSDEPSAPMIVESPPSEFSSPVTVVDRQETASHTETHAPAEPQPATTGRVSVEGTATHQGHDMAAMSWSAWPAWELAYHRHETQTVAEHHNDEPEHAHPQTHSPTRHVADHLFVPVMADMSHADAVATEAMPSDGDTATPSHDAVHPSTKPPTHAKLNVLLEELSPTPAIAEPTPTTAGVPTPDSFAAAIVAAAEPATVRFHFELSEPTPNVSRLFGWCSLSLFMLWCGWKMQAPQAPHRPRRWAAG